MSQRPSDFDDRMFPPSMLPRGNHFLPGDYVEYLRRDDSPDSTYVPIGTPGVVLGLTDAVAVTAAWSTHDGGLVYDEVYDQDMLGRITGDEFHRRNAEIRNGQWPSARIANGWGEPLSGYPNSI